MRRVLLRCTNQNCQVPESRDLAACLNMLYSDCLLRENGQIPERFKCDVPQQSKRPREHPHNLQGQSPAHYPRNQQLLMFSYLFNILI
ncbi:hypothetical protein G6F61_005410 [Rhizopus arrhizus]|nr:hypothetical protein G6F61_005410 [Rhizopus arrhizus]